MSGANRRGGPNRGREEELDRFTRFLRDQAAGYHAPPATPRETMWGAIEGSLVAPGADDRGEGAAFSGPEAVGAPGVADDPLASATAGYHAPPPAPRDELWQRIEAGWTARSPAEIHPLEEQRAGGENRRRRVVPWLSGLAIAASLLIGIAIGRRSAEELIPNDAGPVAGIPAPEETAPSAVGPDETIEIVPLETAPRPDRALAASDPGVRSPGVGPEAGPAAALAATERPADAGPDLPSRRTAAVRYATLEHFGRVETLLTSFQAGADASDDVVDVSAWAGRLLAETRLLLDLPVEREPGTRVLLEELELVLAQIAATRPGSPGDRELAADGLERTLPRLRAITPVGAAGTQVGT